MKADLLTLQKLETLSNTSQDLLIIDDTYLKKRMDTMQSKILATKDIVYPDKNSEIVQYLAKFNGMYAKYDEFLETYPPLLYDDKALIKRLATLKNNRKENKIAHQEFEKLATKLLDDYKNHIKNLFYIFYKHNFKIFIFNIHSF